MVSGLHGSGDSSFEAPSHKGPKTLSALSEESGSGDSLTEEQTGYDSEESLSSSTDTASIWHDSPFDIKRGRFLGFSTRTIKSIVRSGRRGPATSRPEASIWGG